MNQQPLDAPGHFARLVTAAVRYTWLKEERLTGRGLARRLGRSEKYVRERLNGKFSFSLNDIEIICLFVGQSPEIWIAKIVHDEEFAKHVAEELKQLPAIETPEPKSLDIKQLIATADETDAHDEDDEDDDNVVTFPAGIENDFIPDTRPTHLRAVEEDIEAEIADQPYAAEKTDQGIGELDDDSR
ncbi:hypothetical protein [Gulosibacter faecalis]|uniref:HTH cro/C1-type domain-containing protein n=1 Tax=Gulosibacter faecalis TaxID=272240 RepID=A0ABW5UTX5_9MICO|nr:hypothetical protein [Gulosibacter faecalis]